MHSERASECHQALRARKIDHLASGEYIQAFTDPTTAFEKLIGAATGPGIDDSLVLAPVPIVSSSVIELCDPEIGRVSLPVSSFPIRILTSPPQPRRRDGAATATVTATTNK